MAAGCKIFWRYGVTSEEEFNEYCKQFTSECGLVREYLEEPGRKLQALPEHANTWLLGPMLTCLSRYEATRKSALREQSSQIRDWEIEQNDERFTRFLNGPFWNELGLYFEGHDDLACAFLIECLLAIWCDDELGLWQKPESSEIGLTNVQLGLKRGLGPVPSYPRKDKNLRRNYFIRRICFFIDNAFSRGHSPAIPGTTYRPSFRLVADITNAVFEDFDGVDAELVKKLARYSMGDRRKKVAN